MANLFTIGLQQDLPIDNPLIGLFDQIVEAVILLLQRAADMLVGDDVSFQFACQTIGHPHDGGELHLGEGEPLLMITQPAGVTA